MKKLFSGLMLATCVFTASLPVATVHAAEAATVTVDLSENGFIKESTNLVLGTNNDWSGTTEFIIQNHGSTEPSDEFVNFWHTTGVPLANSRQGGGSSMNFDWMSLVGPLEERTPVSSNVSYGTAEWIKCAMEVNPDAAFTPVLNIFETPEQCADLVRYLTLNPEDANAVNPNTGINWAQQRVNDGIKDPVNVIAFELGNELYGYFNQNYGAPEWKTAGLPSWGTIEQRLRGGSSQYSHYRQALINGATEYAEYCKPYIDAVRAVDPDVKLSANANAAAEIDGAHECTHIWNSIVIEALRDYCGGHCNEGCTGNCYNRGINFVTHHDYYWGSTQHSTKIDGTYDRISRYFEDRDIKIMVTEHNILTSYTSSMTSEERTASIKKDTSLERTLAIADFLVSSYNVPEIYSANHHGTFGNAYGNPWAIGRKFTSGQIYQTGEKGKMYSTPVGQVMALVEEAVGGNVMKTEAQRVVASAHLKNDGRLDLILLNRGTKYDSSQSKYVIDHQDITVDIDITGTDAEYRLESVSMIDGEAGSLNDPLTPEGAVVRSTLINGALDYKSFDMSAYSMAVLHLVPNDFEYQQDTVGKIKFRNNGDTLQIWDKFYTETGAKYKSKVGAVLLKNGADPENYSAADVCGYGQSTIENDIAYFNIALPRDFESGVYTVVIGNEDFTHVAEYNTCEIKDITFENSLSQTEFDGKPYNNIENEDYTVEVSAVLNKNVSKDATIGATVVYGDKSEISSYSDENLTRVAFADETSVKDGACNISIDMPRGALSGVYTVILGISSENGSGKLAKSFYFTKPDEDIMLLAPPHTADGKDITLMTDMSQPVYAELKRLDGEGDAKVFVGYYKNGVLVNASVADAVFNENSEAAVMLDGNANSENADCIKLFVWDSGANSPLIRTYSVKQ